MANDIFDLYAMNPDAIRGTVCIEQRPADDGAPMRIRVSNNNRLWNLDAFGHDIQAELRAAAENDQEVTVRLEPAESDAYRRVSSVKDAGPNSMRAEHEARLAALGVRQTRVIPKE